MKFGNSFCALGVLVLAFDGRSRGSMASGPRHGVSFFEASQFRFEMLAALAGLQGESLRSRKELNYQEIFQ